MGVCRVCKDKALRRVFQRDGGYASDNADPSSEARGIKIQMKPILKTQNRKDFAAWPCFEDNEIEAVEKVLRSGNVNQWTGSEVTGFEKEYAAYVGVKYAVAVANGSVALDIALAVLDIGFEDEVIVTPRSFVASAGCVALRGATPVFVDVDSDSQNITPDTVKSAISSKTKAVIAVHLAGWWVLMDERDGRKAARSMKLKVVGVLGILLKARREGRLRSLKEAMDRLREKAGFYVREDIYSEIIQEWEEER